MVSKYPGDGEQITDDLLLPHGHITNGDKIPVSRFGVFGERSRQLLVFWLSL